MYSPLCLGALLKRARIALKAASCYTSAWVPFVIDCCKPAVYNSSEKLYSVVLSQVSAGQEYVFVPVSTKTARYVALCSRVLGFTPVCQRRDKREKWTVSKQASATAHEEIPAPNPPLIDELSPQPILSSYIVTLENLPAECEDFILYQSSASFHVPHLMSFVLMLDNDAAIHSCLSVIYMRRTDSGSISGYKLWKPWPGGEFRMCICVSYLRTMGDQAAGL